MKGGKRRLAVIAVAIVAAFVVSGTPVGAQLPDNTVQLIRGQGSDSTVDVMQKLDFAWNNAIGCIVIGTPQELNHTCQVDGPPFSSAENWDHDVALSFFALGSSVGINILKAQGQPNVAKIDYARSSRAPRAGDTVDLKFVAFARDATPWVNFRGQNPNDPPGQHTEAGTPAAGVDRLSVQQIKDIWFNRTVDTGDPAHTCVINNWDQVGGSNAEILVWTSQRGSGERATFDAFLASSGSDISERCIPAQYTDTDLGNGTRVIFENDPGPIRDCLVDPVGAQGPSCTEANDDEQSIFHLGLGAYENLPVHPQEGKGRGADIGDICTDEPPAGDETCNVPITPTGGLTGTIADGTYPFGRFVYNVYRNSGGNVVSNATKRYIGEEGWICKDVHGINPKTNVNYRTEIDNVILGAGFVPIPQGVIGDGNTNSSHCRRSPGLA